jgi:meiosis-specific protein HOP1
MAQAQLVRPKVKQRPVMQQQPRQPETKVEVEQNVKLQQVVQQKQSLQMVQTLLGASIGSLAYIRRLFPDQCFTKMLYTHEIAEDYGKFCNAPEVDNREPGTKITRLQKGITAVQPPEFLWTGLLTAL